MAPVLAQELGHLPMMARVTSRSGDLSVRGHLALRDRKNRLHDRWFGACHRSSISSVFSRTECEQRIVIITVTGACGFAERYAFTKLHERNQWAIWLPSRRCCLALPAAL